MPVIKHIKNVGNKTVPNLQARNSLANKLDGIIVTVLDAADDPLIEEGIGVYQWSAFANKWILLGQGETLAPPLSSIGWKNFTQSFSTVGVPIIKTPGSSFFGPGEVLRKELTFDIDDYVYVLPITIGHDIFPGAVALPYIKWSTNGTQINSVKWELSYSRAKGHNQEPFSQPISLILEQNAAGIAWHYMIAEVAFNDGIILNEPDEVFLFTLRRLPNGDIDNTNLVFGLSFGMHYQSNRESTVNRKPNFFN